MILFFIDDVIYEESLIFSDVYVFIDLDMIGDVLLIFGGDFWIEYLFCYYDN